MKQTLITRSKTVLSENDLGGWTRPAPGLYPHQWLWDSCFIAIGLRHIDIERAQNEIRSLLKGQWHNGMVPHIIFSKSRAYHAGPGLWKASVSQNCPGNVRSSGITQPPMIAEAIVKIGEKLKKKDRLTWYREIFPALSAYHEWLYRDRDPYRSGLATVVHPWESGLDNTPPWMELLHTYIVSNRLWLLESLKLTTFVERFRKDTSTVPAEERMSTYDLYAVYRLIEQLRRYKYNDELILRKHKILLQDAIFNVILVRNTQHLASIAAEINESMSERTRLAHEKGIAVLERFWDEASGQYYSRNFHTNQLIKVPSIATLLPLYAGVLPKARLKRVLTHMRNRHTFATGYPVPSTPINSPYFKPHCYWQGPVWINMNWLIIDGLRRNGCHDEAEKLRESTLRLVSKSGMNEYFSPLHGTPAGAHNFSWTAGLTLDLLES